MSIRVTILVIFFVISLIRLANNVIPVYRDWTKDRRIHHGTENEISWTRRIRPNGWFESTEILESHEKATLDFLRMFDLSHIANKENNETVDEIEIEPFSTVLAPGLSPEENRKKFYELISTLKSMGWNRYIYPQDARVPGREVEKTKIPPEIIHPEVMPGAWGDISHELNLEQWHQLPQYMRWQMHLDGTYLTVDLLHYDWDLTSAGYPTYTVSFLLKSERRFYRSFVDPSDNSGWKDVVPLKLHYFQKDRAAAEKKLIEDGINIDETYQDPPIRALM